MNKLQTKKTCIDFSRFTLYSPSQIISSKDKWLTKTGCPLKLIFPLCIVIGFPGIFSAAQLSTVGIVSHGFEHTRFIYKIKIFIYVLIACKSMKGSQSTALQKKFLTSIVNRYPPTYAHCEFCAFAEDERTFYQTLGTHQQGSIQFYLKRSQLEVGSIKCRCKHKRSQ